MVAVAHDELIAQLTTVWEGVLETHPLGVDDDFFLRGGDSLLAVGLVAELERAFGRRLPLDLVLRAPTIGRLAETLRREGDQSPRPAVVPLRGGGSGAEAPFFVLPGSGGHLFNYYWLARHYGGRRPFYGLQFRGPDEQRALPRLEDMAAHFVAEVRALQPEGPYRLGGYSFGGVLAYEMAQQLTAAGQTVALLALFDSYSPGFPRPVLMLRRLVRHARHVLQAGPSGGLRYICGRLASAARQVSGAASSPPNRDARDPEARARAEFTAANRRAMHQYVPRPYPGHVVLFRAEIQPQWIGFDFSDPTLGWGHLVTGRLELVPVPGDHWNLFQEPQVRVLAAQLRDSLG
ncbi:MAG: non-ribosomal peptide synthetase [Isosphaeraceae bacterium]|nr:non-ribosomal peptide synthetase [Isosphaeraceae bacterium]